MDVQMAEKLESEGRLLEALNKYNQVEPMFRAITQEYPEFHDQIVKKRLALVKQAQARLRAQIQKASLPGKPTQ